MYDYTPDAAEDVPGVVTGYWGAGRLNHGDISFTFSDNVGNDDTDSAVNSQLSSLIDSYKSSLVGIFDGENIGGGDNPGGGDDPTPGPGDEPTPEGTILCSFDGAPSVSMFTAADNYGDGKITYEGVYYKKGEKMDSKGSITFTPTKNYDMTIVLGTAKGGKDVSINGTKTTVSGTENTDGKYYELQPIEVTANTAYTITKGSAESLVMIIKLVPKE